jgi:hypothetical protein
MAYDEAVAQRTRAVLANVPGLTEKKMFGGIAFLVQGNMACERKALRTFSVRLSTAIFRGVPDGFRTRNLLSHSQALCH